jgi:hypothetical protein
VALASTEMVKQRMPVSAYLKAIFFVVAAAAAWFAAAGTVAIPEFWAYLAIFAIDMIVSFAALDPDLLRERMRPGGKKPPLALTVFSLVLFMHWIVAGLDRGRPLERRRARLAARHFPRFRGATHPSGYDNRSRHCKVSLPGPRR